MKTAPVSPTVSVFERMINLAEQALYRAVCMFGAEVGEKGWVVGLLSHSSKI